MVVNLHTNVGWLMYLASLDFSSLYRKYISLGVVYASAQCKSHAPHRGVWWFCNYGRLLWRKRELSLLNSAIL